MRIAFMGTPDFAVPFLQSLHAAGHEIAAVYTRPPGMSGRRGLTETPSAVHQAAAALGLPVFTPKTLRDATEQERFAALNLDAAVIVAYGLLLPGPILAAPRLGCYNGHASLLPRWRGAAPVQRAIEAGDKETGLCIMRMDEGLDTGPILCRGRDAAASPLIFHLAISADMTAGAAFAALAAGGAKLMTQALAFLAAGDFSLRPQPESGICYAHKIAKEEARIVWQRPAAEVKQHICAFAPFPGAWCEMRFGGKNGGRPERVKILGAHIPSAAELAAAERQGLIRLKPTEAESAAAPAAESVPAAPAAAANMAAAPAKAAFLAAECAGGALLLLTELQKAGGKALPAQDFLRGAAPLAVS